MSIYTGNDPADGHSAQAGINWLSHQQTQANLQSPTTVRATSNSTNYAAPVTPAQAYERPVVSGQPVLQYTIERQQLERPSRQQPGSNLQSPIGASAVTRGQSHAQRMHASSLSKQSKAQTRQQLSSGPGESGNRVLAGASYGDTAHLLLNRGHNDTPQTVSTLDFYHGSVSKLDLQSPVPGLGTNSPGAPHPRAQSATGSASSIAYSSVPIQAPHGVQASSRRGSVSAEIPDGPLLSPVTDPRQSSQVGSPTGTTYVTPDSWMSLDAPLRLESANNVVASLVPLDDSTASACMAAISSNPKSVTRPSDPFPAPIQTESLDVGGPEEAPLNSLVDKQPPPLDFDKSQSMHSMTRTSTYHAESHSALALLDVPSSTPHESDTVSGAIPSTGADTPSSAGTPRAAFPEPLSGSLQTSLAMPDVASYPTGKAPEGIKEKPYGYFAEDSMPELSDKSSSCPYMEASSSSRILSEQTASDRQPSQDIPHPPISQAVSPHNGTSAKTFFTAPLPTLPPRRLVSSTSKPITASPLPALPPRRPVASSPAPVIAAPLLAPPQGHPAVPPMRLTPPPRHPALPPRHLAPILRHRALASRHPVASTPTPITACAPPPTMPVRPHTLNPRASPTNPVDFGPATSLPLRPGSSHQPTSLPLPPRVRAEPTSPPSSTGIPPFITTSAGTTSQINSAPSPSSPLPSLSFFQHSQGPLVLSAPSTNSRPAGLISQLSQDASPTRQAPYHSPREDFQPQASPLPPQQHARALRTPAKPVHSSRGLGKNIAAGLAGGVLGLLGEAVLVETLGGGDIVDDITGIMDGMTIGNPADGQFDPNMGTGDILGNGFDPTANLQGDQTFTEDFFDPTANIQVDQTFAGSSFDTTYYQEDQTFTEDFFDPTANIQVDQTFSGSSFDTTYYQEDQTFTENLFDPAANIQVDQTFASAGNSFDTTYYQGDQTYYEDFFDPTTNIQIDQTFTEDLSDPTANIQVDQMFVEDSFDATYYQGDQVFVGDRQTYDMFYQTTGNGVDFNQFQGAAQGSQPMAQLQQTSAFVMSGTTNTGRPPNSMPIGYAQTSASIPLSETSFDHFTASGHPTPTQQTGQSIHPIASQTSQLPIATSSSQHHPSVHFAPPQGIHPLAQPRISHTQKPYINHGAYPSFGTATHTMQSQGPPIPAQHAVNHGHSTAPHHAYLPQFQAGHSAHPARYHAQGNLQQNHPSQHPQNAGRNKPMQFVKGALIAGGVLAGLVGNGNGGSS
ncbi:uncharacterized protein EDB93DRAFT_1312025 [Suillus bovinus]|uniref:uncharacterized protein n=1 Tax=Suillus bovinus TaxID=48563 RepID=UPI001B86F7AF|nr:uncharacterized protein EDB93DRAFT_1312025 [Suillus bovinus]KAG2130995.1 hypothetical protein EDB93DRAFT_1312025 [Suillus bovinus]